MKTMKNQGSKSLKKSGNQVRITCRKEETNDVEI
jgi:hypothetical protein